MARVSEPATRAALRARWEALADSMLSGSADEDDEDDDEPTPLPPPIVIKPRRRQSEPSDEAVGPSAWKPDGGDESAPLREPTLILHEPPAAPPPSSAAIVARTQTSDGQAILGRTQTSDGQAIAAPTQASDDAAIAARTQTSDAQVIAARTQTGDGQVVVAARTSSDELWSDPTSIPALVDQEPKQDVRREAGRAARDAGHAGLEDARVSIRTSGAAAPASDRDASADGWLDETGDAAMQEVASDDETSGGSADESEAGHEAGAGASKPRDFARELRAKMSMMAQRLFHRGDAPATSPADHAPRHDHHTEIDLAALVEDPALASVAELEAGAPRLEPGELATSPGAWDTQVRERRLPDTGTIVRGAADAAMLLARMFAQGATGRIAFRRDEVETIVHFDHGRPVFASSNEPRDRMGELLLREGKITASQYERCQTVVAESGRRMGEILVDFGYLKRRELLPAVRRHVEDLVYSLFGWERGTYTITMDAEPCAERIRLSRHPAALILEGVRRKFDRSSLERLIGPPSTVVEVRDRERLGGVVHMGDLAPEERAALATFDGQADLAQVARTAGVDITDVLPLAWALCVLGLATARRADAEAPDEATALIGETDLAIDRERVRARWQLVTDADYFALLGVRRDATGFEIRRAYQSARRDFAADCFPSDLRRELARELDEIAQVLDEAFRVLRDDRLRKTYLANLIDR
jgi:hypothetical protein